jgi:hypothetical protein
MVGRRPPLGRRVGAVNISTDPDSVYTLRRADNFLVISRVYGWVISKCTNRRLRSRVGRRLSREQLKRLAALILRNFRINKALVYERYLERHSVPHGPCCRQNTHFCGYDVQSFRRKRVSTVSDAPEDTVTPRCDHHHFLRVINPVQMSHPDSCVETSTASDSKENKKRTL